MQFYFVLRYRMLNRQLAAFGIHPLLGYMLMAVVFGVFSFYLFHRMAMAPYLYAAIGLLLSSRQSDGQRNEFLRISFPDQAYLKIRVIENLLTVTPFAIYLVYRAEYLLPAIMAGIACGMALTSFTTKMHITIPTPFYRFPFEFAAGFRQSFLIILAAYFLAVMSVAVHNFNLGIFSLILMTLVCASWYSRPEPTFYVWIFATSAKAFLWSKIKIGIAYTLLLCLPITLALIFQEPGSAPIILGTQMLGLILIITVMLGKYAAYPAEIAMPQVIAIVLSLVFVPLLALLIPFFYLQSVRRLQNILG